MSFCSPQQHTDQAQVTKHKWFASTSVVAEGTFHSLPSMHKAGGTERAEGEGKPWFFLLCSIHLLMTNMLAPSTLCSEEVSLLAARDVLHGSNTTPATATADIFTPGKAQKLSSDGEEAPQILSAFFPPLLVLSQTMNVGSGLCERQCTRRVLHF